ncbi:MAG: shikimate dehydrogenase [Verrucomicrobia bacterium]|nr:shikimate dehydrogenase [Verrucomicrobiota bacterium]
MDLALSDLRAGVAEPVRLVVVGDPIAHSRSPEMQNAALEAVGSPLRYGRLRLAPDELAEGLELLAAQGFRGANVTIPHKLAVRAHCARLSEGAQALGAVNTLLLEDGRWTGFNTDGPGFERALRESFGLDLHDLRVLILGAGGGAGRALAAQCALAPCERLVLANRDVAKARALAAELQPIFGRRARLLGPGEGLEVCGLDPTALARQLAQTDLLVHCTPLGLSFADPLPLPPRLLEPHHLVYDTVYRADGETRLVQTAREQGARAASGESMLLHQGALAFELWHGRTAPLEVMRQALRRRG